ncbi:hypothetical protein GYA93_15245 [Gordonia desulfuricans]|uniref:Uncharacterized protein n=1 Tax=Gordonia desulfuricans TaxID=89051 RepID=A0A7K3LRS1_9ACTN|nr:hypothetical protein [Gordonia desulfuricans]NDK90928.1 hypothetical protein [Gordonia desulfuricans]
MNVTATPHPRAMYPRAMYLRRIGVGLIAATALVTGIVTTAGPAQAAPPRVAPAEQISIDVPSTYLWLSDPFPFGVETLRVTVTGPGVLTMTLGTMCASLNPRVCATYSLPMQVGWINLNTGRSGTLTVTPKGAEVTTGSGLIGIGDLFGIPSVPGAATIRA